jgi:hypothetical protein
VNAMAQTWTMDYSGHLIILARCQHIKFQDVLTELPLGAHVSGTAPASRSFATEATASFEEIDAHANSMAFSTYKVACTLSNSKMGFTGSHQ